MINSHSSSLIMLSLCAIQLLFVAALRAPIVQTSKKASHLKFSLSEFTHLSLLNEADTVQLSVVKLSQLHSSFSEESSSLLVLVDLSVRSVDEVDISLPFWGTMKLKLKHSGEVVV